MAPLSTAAGQVSQMTPDVLSRDSPRYRRTSSTSVTSPTCRSVTGGNLYLATVIDCCSRGVAGWAIVDHVRIERVEDALKAADAVPGGFSGSIFPSDHRSHCTSADLANP
jgi:transposase InsO family protein